MEGENESREYLWQIRDVQPILSPEKMARMVANQQAPKEPGTPFYPENTWPASENDIKVSEEPRYKVIKALGGGGYGKVYKAYDEKLGITVAIKFFSSDQYGSEPESLEIEAKAIANLEHPNIVRVYSFFETRDAPKELIGKKGKVPAMVTEFVEGGSLDTQIQSITPEQTGDIILQTASAVDFMARHGVFHKDLKPANIMLSTDGFVKVADFGTASNVYPIGKDEYGNNESAVGSPKYMAPEIALGKDNSEASEMYTLASVAYEFITKEPFVDTTGKGNYQIVQELMLDKGRGVTPDKEEIIRTKLKGTNADADKVISILRQALSYDPADRATAFNHGDKREGQASILAFANALKQALNR
jgi:serine/threonine protein kinase